MYLADVRYCQHQDIELNMKKDKTTKRTMFQSIHRTLLSSTGYVLSIWICSLKATYINIVCNRNSREERKVAA
jgi:hypothetical protein